MLKNYTFISLLTKQNWTFDNPSQEHTNPTKTIQHTISKSNLSYGKKNLHKAQKKTKGEVVNGNNFIIRNILRNESDYVNDVSQNIW